MKTRRSQGVSGDELRKLWMRAIREHVSPSRGINPQKMKQHDFVKNNGGGEKKNRKYKKQPGRSRKLYRKNENAQLDRN